MRKRSAILTSGGQGERLKPLCMSDKGTVLPKYVMRLMGHNITGMQFYQLQQAGINELHVVTRGTANRYFFQLKYGDGKNFGFKIFYSHASDDETNIASGNSLLNYLDNRNLTGNSLVMPNDNIFELDIDAAFKLHEKENAIISIATKEEDYSDVFSQYGVVLSGTDQIVTKFLEKPSEEILKKALKLGPDDSLPENLRLKKNTAVYIIDNDQLREAVKKDKILHQLYKSGKPIDIGGTLLTHFAEKGYKMVSIPINFWSDLGSPRFLLGTMKKVLRGQFSTITDMITNEKLLDGAMYKHLPEKNIWIHPETYALEIDGMTLEQRIEQKKVTFGKDVFLGREVKVYSGVDITTSNVEKYSTLRANSKLDTVYVSEGSDVGSFANLNNSALGIESVIRSSEAAPTKLSGMSVIGPNVTLLEGTDLDNVTVFPGVNLEAGTHSHKVYKI